jgi:hypothetical protein
MLVATSNAMMTGVDICINIQEMKDEPQAAALFHSPPLI